MNHSSRMRALIAASGIAALTAAGLAAAASSSTYIVKASSTEQAARLVHEVGGRVLSALPVIDAVGAELDAAERVQLSARTDVRVYLNRSVDAAASKNSSGNSTTSKTAAATTTSKTPTTTSTSATTDMAASSAALLDQIAASVRTLVDDYSSDVALVSGTSPQIASFLYDPNYAALVAPMRYMPPAQPAKALRSRCSIAACGKVRLMPGAVASWRPWTLKEPRTARRSPAMRAVMALT